MNRRAKLQEPLHLVALEVVGGAPAGGHLDVAAVVEVWQGGAPVTRCNRYVDGEICRYLDIPTYR